MATAVKDPVCQMDVQPEKSAGTVDHQGKTYYFCSRHCADKFRAQPEQYLTPLPATPAPLISIGGSRSPVSLVTIGAPAHPVAVAIDPVCGMRVDPARAAAKFEYRGSTYYFCNPRCADKFRAEPEHYLDSSTEKRMPPAALAPVAGQRTAYTRVRSRPACPMRRASSACGGNRRMLSTRY